MATGRFPIYWASHRVQLKPSFVMFLYEGPKMQGFQKGPRIQEMVTGQWDRNRETRQTETSEEINRTIQQTERERQDLYTQKDKRGAGANNQGNTWKEVKENTTKTRHQSKTGNKVDKRQGS